LTFVDNNASTYHNSMKPARLFLVSALIVISGVMIISAEEDSPAALQMKHIGKGFKTLSTQISDPAKKESSLKTIDAMLHAVNASKPLIPAPADKLKGEALKTYIREYAKGLSELEASLQDLKKAVAAGDTSTAQNLVSAINKLKKTYHSDLR